PRSTRALSSAAPDVYKRQMPDEWRVQQKTQLKEQMGWQATTGNIAQQFGDLLQKNGEPGDLDGVGRVVAHGNSGAARGLRNNNPGNIEAGSNPWDCL
ncbi:hypothetical protein ELO29_29755, partial [Klebsiella pneumoniae]|nr:hypothetical protein [Klebsiella pneumoniae]